MDTDEIQETQPLPLEQLLPLRCLTVVLQFTSSSHPKFFHQASLSAFVRHLLREPDDFDTLIRIESLESGRTDFSPGDRYVFRAFGLNGSEALLELLVARLKDLPHSAQRRERRICFRDNLRLLELRDSISNQPITSTQELSCFGADDLLQATEHWASKSPHEILLSFTSPVRLLKDKQQRTHSKGESRYCHDSKDLNSELLVSRIRDSFADLLRRRGASALPPRSASPKIDTCTDDLFWLENIYNDPAAHERGMGGLSGTITISAPNGLSLDWWKLLVLGQLTGIGQRTSQGWGRFNLGTKTNNPNTWLQDRLTHGIFEQVMGEQNLLSSYYHSVFEDEELSKLGQFSKKTGQTQQAQENPVSYFRSLFDKLLNDTEQTTEPTENRPESDSPEDLTPTFEHRVLQQAITQTLMPRLTLLRNSNNKPEQSQEQLGALALDKRMNDKAEFAKALDKAKNTSAKKVRVHLAALFGEDPLFDYAESSLSTSQGCVNTYSPLSSLIGPPMGMQAITKSAWMEEPRKHRPKITKRRPEIRTRSKTH